MDPSRIQNLLTLIVGHGGYFDICPTSGARIWPDLLEAEQLGIVARYVDLPWCVCWQLTPDYLAQALAVFPPELKGTIRKNPPKPITNQTDSYAPQEGY